MKSEKQKILIIGAYGTFTNELIQRFYKEKHTIYLICGENEKKKSRKVFEQYSFSYQSGSMRRIMESVKPDIVLFTGVYDPLFTWKNMEVDSVSYIASLMNVLLACEQNEIERFIYLSNEKVYQETYSIPIQEDERMTPKSFIGRTFAQAEELVKSYQDHSIMQVITLRIANLYGMAQERKECQDIVSEMILDALTKPALACRNNCSYQVTHIKDALEAVYRVCMEPHPNYDAYHIASPDVITDEILALWIVAIINQNLYIDHVDHLHAHRVFDSSRFQNEFDFTFFSETKKGVQRVAQYMLEHKDKFLTAEEMNAFRYQTLWQKICANVKVLWPYVESIFVLFIIYYASYVISTDMFFGKVDLFVLYILLFSVAYGKGQGIFASCLSVVAYFYYHSQLAGIFDTLINYETYVWIAQLFIIAMSVGHLHDQLYMMKEDKEEEIHFLNHQLKDMQTIHSSNLKVKDVLENRIINYDDSLGKIYDITSKLDSMDSRDVVFRAAPMIASFLDTEDVAIYQIVNDEYARLISTTSKEAKSLGKSIQYRKMKEMLLAFDRQAVYINRKMDPTMPFMANALYEGDDIELIVMVWGLPLERMTNQQANVLSILCLMLNKALNSASLYMKAQEHETYVTDSSLMTQKSFHEMIDMYHHASKQGLCDMALLKVKETSTDVVTLTKKIMNHLRMNDFIGVYQQEELCILLTNTTEAEAKIVEERLFTNDIMTEIIKVGG